MDKMDFSLGNPQEEAPKRIEKKPKKKRTWLLIVLAVVVLLGVLAAVLWDANSFDGLRRSIIYSRAEKDEHGCARLYDYSGDRTSRFTSLDGSLLITSPNQIRLVTESGAVRYEEGIRFQSCGVVQKNAYAAVFDIGGTDIYVLDSHGLVRHMTADGQILSVTLSEKGYMAVTVNGSGYKATVNVYDEQGQPVFDFHSADRFVTTAAVSRDGKYVTAVALGEASGIFASDLVTYKMTSTEPSHTESFTGGAVYDVGALGRGFCAVAEDGLHFLSISGAMTADYSFHGDSLRRCSLDGEGFAVVLLGHYKSGSQCRLVTVDDSGTEIASLEVDSDVLDLSVSGRYVAALFSDHLTIYDKLLGECATMDDVSSVRQVMVRSDGSAVLAGLTAASLYLP